MSIRLLHGDFRVNYIFEEIHKRQVPDTIAKGERGEVFTPPELVRRLLFGLRKNSIQKGKEPEIWGLDKDGNFFDDPAERVGGLPDDVWSNPKTKFLDPANGIGNFPIVAFYKLNYELAKLPEFKDDTKRQNHIVHNMLYMLEIDPNNNKECERLLKCMAPNSKKINVICGDTIEKDAKKEKWLVIDRMKKAWADENWDGATFNVIMGNPPYQKPLEGVRKGGYGGRDLWSVFVDLSIHLLESEGYLLFIHPPPWRKPEADLWNEMVNNNNMIFIDIYNKKDAEKFFNASTRFDMYILKKNKNNNNTEISDEHNNYNKINLHKLPFLPNYNFENIQKIMCNNDGIEVIYSRSKFGSDKKGIQKKKTDEFKFPIVHFLGQRGDGIDYIYTNKRDSDDLSNQKQFGVPKVLMTFNERQYPVNDWEGKYGMSQIIFGIPINNKKEGDDIVEAVNSKDFEEIIKATKWGVFNTDWRMFKYFKKDFYKQAADKIIPAQNVIIQ